MEKKEIIEKLKKHELWISNNDLGERLNLSGRDLSEADLSGANLSGADLSGADLSSFNISPIENLDKKILDLINIEGNSLNMEKWHTCSTTHCRAGWTIIISGENGKELEEKFGTNVAASLIYAVSRPGKKIPNWFDDEENTIKDLENNSI